MRRMRRVPRWWLTVGLATACAVPASAQVPAGAERALQRPAAEFWDGNTARGSLALAPAAVYAGAPGPASEAPAFSAVPAVGRAVRVPTPHAEPQAVSCEGALAHYPTAARLCDTHPVLAPLLGGLLDAFRQQFGTLQGIAENLLWILISVLITAISGFGAVARIAMSVVSLGLSAWMLWPLVKQGYGAVKDLRRSAPGTQERYASLFSLGVVGGTVLILALMTAAGYAIGKSKAGGQALTSLDRVLDAGAVKLGLPRSAAAPAPAGTMAGIFNTVAEPSGIRAGHAIRRGAQLGTGFQDRAGEP